jgi:crossover junction endonuclease MUS81
VTYLVEDYRMSGRWKIDAQMFRKAMSDTQLHDGFFLKRTSSLDETIHYLTQMTHHVNTTYLAGDLCAVRDRALHHAGHSIGKARDALRRRLSRDVFVSYGLFQDLNTKSKSRTLGETFVYQLLRIKGISPSKARAITTVYPVLRA